MIVSNENEFVPIENGAKRKFALKTILKVIFTLLLLGFIYSRLDYPVLIERISSIEPTAFLIIFFLYLAGQVLSSFKWRVFLAEAGIEVSQIVIIRAFFLGMFINTFGFGTVGGDVARALAIPCQKGFRAAAIATVLADRIHGLSTLLMIGTVSLLIVRPDYLPDYALYLLFGLLTLLLSAWLFGPRIVLSLLPTGSLLKDRLERVFKAFPRSMTSLILATLISVSFHSVQIVMAYEIFQIIKTPISLSLAYTTVPFINAASALPITVNGLGVRELVATHLLYPAGVLKEASVAFAAIWVLVVTLVSAIGGLLILPLISRRSEKVLGEKVKMPTTYNY